MNSRFSRPTQADRETWLKLAERCQSAEKGGVNLDADMARALGWGYGYIGQERCWYDAGGRMQVQPFRWSRSLDDITALVEQELPGSHWGFASARHDFPPYGWVGDDADGPAMTGKTPALALCAAFCRAMAERDA